MFEVFVIPAKAGIQGRLLNSLDPHLRGDDGIIPGYFVLPA